VIPRALRRRGAPRDPAFAFQLKLFFLVCVTIAAIYGAWSVKPRILFIQGGPAIFALVLTVLAS
jgi:putative membrane protein